MKALKSYINIRKKPSTVEATDKTIYNIVIGEIERLGLDADLNHIDVSEVTNMDGLFSDCADKYKDINPDISKWNVSNVNDMRYMFEGCEKFNCDISGWDVSNVEYMQQVFSGCKIFNQNLSGWNVGNVKYMQGMFYECENFNQDISCWDVSKVERMNFMFVKCKNFNCDISKWDVSNIKYHSDMFEGCHIKEEFKPKFIV